MKVECWELIGMSKQRMGSVAPSETATGTRTAMQQSYSETEPLFVAHEYVQGQLYQAIVDAALYTESKKPQLAEKAFENKDYKTAIKLYSQLLKLNPEDPISNYRKGVSLYHTEQNKLKALPYLTEASKSTEVPYDVFYYQARSYHLWSDFDKAQKAYLNFKRKADPKEVIELNIIRLIENCINGKKLMNKQLNMETLSKSPIFIDKQVSKFRSSY